MYGDIVDGELFFSMNLQISGNNSFCMDKMITMLNKISLPLGIVLASFILGGFIMIVQINKQHSIEKQQQTELFEKRKRDCLAIYEVEIKKWNNVQRWEYGYSYTLGAVTCTITYSDPKTGKDFEQFF